MGAVRGNQGAVGDCVVVPVQELDPGGGLGVHHVHVGQVGEGEHGYPPGLPARFRSYAQIVAHDVRLAGTRDQLDEAARAGRAA